VRNTVQVGRARLLWEHLSALNVQPTNLNGKVLTVIGVFSLDILTQKIRTVQKKKQEYFDSTRLLSETF
jgi:hypothetical protein